MELIAIVLSGIFSLFSSGGFIVDTIANRLIFGEEADKTLSDQRFSVEKQAVRIDNTPNYQIAQGKIDKVRIACRGVNLNSYLRIDTLELETDAIAINLQTLNTQSLQDIRSSLIQPLQGAGKIILTESDLTKALQSPQLQKELQQILNNLVARKAGNSTIAYEISSPKLQLNSKNRIKIDLELRRLGKNRQRASKLAISLEFGIKVLGGKQIQLVNPTGTVNSRPMSSRLLQGFAQGISDRLDLTTIETQGILIRLLQLEITDDEIELVAFARMETKSASITSTEIVKP